MALEHLRGYDTGGTVEGTPQTSDNLVNLKGSPFAEAGGLTSGTPEQLAERRTTLDNYEQYWRAKANEALNYGNTFSGVVDRLGAQYAPPALAAARANMYGEDVKNRQTAAQQALGQAAQYRSQRNVMQGALDTQSLLSPTKADGTQKTEQERDADAQTALIRNPDFLAHLGQAQQKNLFKAPIDQNVYSLLPGFRQNGIPKIQNAQLKPSDLIKAAELAQKEIDQVSRLGVDTPGVQAILNRYGLGAYSPEQVKAWANGSSTPPSSPTNTATGAPTFTDPSIKIISGDRANAQQQALWDESVRAGRPGKTASGNPIAKPGTSAHETPGGARDIQTSALTPSGRKELAEKGYYQPFPKDDPNHWERYGTNSPQTAAPNRAQAPASVPAASTSTNNPAANIDSPLNAPKPFTPDPQAPLQSQVKEREDYNKSIEAKNKEYNDTARTVKDSTDKRISAANRIEEILNTRAGKDAQKLFSTPGILNAITAQAAEGAKIGNYNIGVDTEPFRLNFQNAAVKTAFGDLLKQYTQLKVAEFRAAYFPGFRTTNQIASMESSLAPGMADTPELVKMRVDAIRLQARIDDRLVSDWNHWSTTHRRGTYQDFEATPYYRAIHSNEPNSARSKAFAELRKRDAATYDLMTVLATKDPKQIQAYRDKLLQQSQGAR